MAGAEADAQKAAADRNTAAVARASEFASEPCTDYRSTARRYENCVLAGEGDNRICATPRSPMGSWGS